MNDRLVRDELVSGSVLLQTPRQAPPIDRTAAVPAGAHGDHPGVEADFDWLGTLGTVAKAALPAVLGAI
ncbi:hypothetical protein [Streptomyces wuyuanensis]|uniref:hypothetical protein n=1 Tax=Streptomyces wuyuanensis TaxID=1196353 RepID=UPI003694EDE2